MECVSLAGPMGEELALVESLRQQTWCKYSEIVWLPTGRTASTSTNADALTGLPNTYDLVPPFVSPSVVTGRSKDLALLCSAS
jgi:hypothetical protein